MEEKLYLAFDSDNRSLVVQLLKKGADPKSKDGNGATALQAACSNGWLDVVMSLVEDYGCDPNSRDKDGRTPLYHVRCVDVARYLVEEKKCSVEVTDSSGRTPIEYACLQWRINFEMVRYLILVLSKEVVNSINIGQEVLAIACQRQDKELAKTVLSCQNREPHQNTVKGFSNDIILAFTSSVDILQFIAPLVNLKEVRDEKGRTLLHYACENGDLSVINCLINEQGCSLDVKDNSDKTPIHSTCDINVVKYLLQYLPNYKPGVSGDPNDEILFFACKFGHLSLVKTATFCHPGMIGRIIRDKDGRVPLHYACIGGHTDVIEYLTNNHRSDPHLMPDNYELTPFHYACLYGHSDAILMCQKQSYADPFLKHCTTNMTKTTETSLYDMLFVACKVGQLGIIKYIIQGLKLKPDISDDNEASPLLLACQNRWLIVVEYLVSLPTFIPDNSEKAEVFLLACLVGNLPFIKVIVEELQWNPNIVTEDQRTPIYIACHNGHYDIVLYLLSLSHYKPNNDEYFAESLFRVCKAGYLEVIKHAIEDNKFDPIRLRDQFQRSLLHLMCQYGHLKMVQYLVEKQGCSLDVRDDGKRTPLHSASLRGHTEVVQYLLAQQNCDMNVKNLFQRTPLHYASLNGHLSVVQYLTNDRRCDPGIGDEHNMTALHFACRSGYLDIVFHLIHRLGCLPDVKDSYGRTPLHYACLHGHNDVIKYLIKKKKCKSDDKDKDHNTPLHCACYKNKLDSVKFLFGVSNRLNINAENKKKMTPFEMIRGPNIFRLQILHFLFEVKSLSDREILQVIERFIQRHQWDSCQTDADGQNALHFASRMGRNEIVLYLLTKTKCDFNARNKNRMSPLMLAKSYDTVIYLIEHGADIQEHEIVSWNGTEEETVRIMIYLIQHKLWDPNEMLNGDNALHLACKANKPHIVKYLLSNVSCNSRNSAGLCPLQMTDNPNVITDIIIHGADSQQAYRKLFFDTDEKTSLSIIKHITTEKSFTLQLWNPSQITCRGENALHYACIVDRALTLHYLLSVAKCDPNTKNNNGETPLDITSNHQIIKYLIQYGADLDCIYKKLTCEMSEEMGLEAIKYLYTSGELDGRTKKGESILHFACRTNLPRVIEYLLCETNTNLNIKNNAGVYPLLAMDIDISKVVSTATEQRALQVVTHLIESQSIEGMTIQGVTALQLACQFSKSSIVHYLLSEANYDPNFENKEGRTLLELSTDSKIIKELIRHGANPSDVYTTHGKLVLGPKCHPLKPSVKVFVVGNPSVGKSTLVAAIQKELSFIMRKFRNKRVSGVDEKTAGVVPHEFESKRYQCGPVTLYDFAGHREFYSSHAALLQTAIHSTPPIFLLVINLCDTDTVIEQNIQFWLSFINNPCVSVDSKPHIIVIGSHADIFKARGGDLNQILPSIANQCASRTIMFAGFVAMDCRYCESADMENLGQLLKKSCDSVRKREPISFNCHCFHAFLSYKFNGKIAVQLRDVISLLNTDDTQNLDQQISTFIPTNLHSLSIICKDLNDSGHLLFLMNCSKIDKSWIILNKASLLTEVTGTLFAPEGFKQHCQLASSTGVVPMSKLTSCFPNQNPEMLVGFLCHLEYCHEIADEDVLHLIDKHQRNVGAVYSSDERYFFFPGLVRLSTPQKVWESKPEQFKNVSGWIIQCSQPEQFFTSRFLQVLMLRLAFKFALIPSSEEKDDNFPAIQRRCSVWKSGIFWGDRYGNEVLVEILPSGKSIVLLIRGRENSVLEYIQLRSQVVKRIRKCVKELCKQIVTEESLLDPSDASKYPAKPSTMFSIAEVAKSILDLSGCPSIPTSTGSISVSELMTFEPYAMLGETMLSQLYIKSTNKVSDDYISSFDNHIIIDNKVERDLLIKIFSGYPPKPSLSNAFLSWRESGLGTYKQLQEKLEDFSIFSLEDIVVSISLFLD